MFYRCFKYYHNEMDKQAHTYTMLLMKLHIVLINNDVIVNGGGGDAISD